jgi:CBS domain containing-hemolysin-like protein
MNMSVPRIIQLLILVALMAASGYFSSVETALLSLGRLRIRHLVEENVESAKTVERLLENQGRLLGTILLGNTMVNIAATALATIISVSYFGEGLGLGLSTVVMTLAVLIFGEMTPKTYALYNSQRIALRYAGSLDAIYTVLSPLVHLLDFISKALLRSLGLNRVNTLPTFSEDELKTFVTVGQEEGILQVEEKDMITSIIEFGDTLVKDVMTPRTDIIRVSTRISYTELLAILRRDNFSRVPVYEKSIDEVIGILHAKDLLGITEEQFSIKDMLRPPYFIPEFKPVSALLTEFKKKKLHMAIVVDEYGGTAGLITLEDLVEEIVGEIADEFDDDEQPEFSYVDENNVHISGAMSVRDAETVLGRALPDGGYDTVGGMIMSLLGTIPQKGDRVEINGMDFGITAMKGSRVSRVLVKINKRN